MSSVSNFLLEYNIFAMYVIVCAKRERGGCRERTERQSKSRKIQVRKRKGSEIKTDISHSMTGLMLESPLNKM